jgi:hypothetical protein
MTKRDKKGKTKSCTEPNKEKGENGTSSTENAGSI